MKQFLVKSVLALLFVTTAATTSAQERDEWEGKKISTLITLSGCCTSATVSA